MKLNEFHLRYYLPEDWPFDKDYADAESYVEAAKEKLEYHLSRLEAFINDQKPGVELERLCRQEIEADYYSELIQSQEKLFSAFEILTISTKQCITSFVQSVR